MTVTFVSSPPMMSGLSNACNTMSNCLQACDTFIDGHIICFVLLQAILKILKDEGVLLALIQKVAYYYYLV